MELWSWLLSAMGAVSIYLAGRKKRVGWLVGLLSEVVWVVYALLTRQFGFIPGAGLYGIVQWKNWRAWKEDALLDEELRLAFLDAGWDEQEGDLESGDQIQVSGLTQEGAQGE